MKKSKSDRKRPQASKNTAFMRDMQEIRRSSATSPIPSATKYKRAKAGARGRDW